MTGFLTNTSIAVTAICIVFLLASIVFYKVSIGVRRKSILIALVVGYLLLIYPYFEAINALHYYLRDRGVYIEFGHASLVLLVLFLLSYLAAGGIAFLTILKWKKVSTLR